MKTVFFLLVAIVASLANAQLMPGLLDPSASTTTSTGGAKNKGNIEVNYFNSDQPEYFKYGTCISFRRPNRMIKNIQVPTLAICYVYEDQECKVSRQVQGLPYLPIMKTLNVANLASALWGAFICFDFPDSPTGQHLQDPSMFGPLEHLGMDLTPPSPVGAN